ncbi:hypothetical protein [Kitasatospora kifunensis]|uniref:DNA-directed RNA polymerase specialized sigma24 family protein n=1 Tax=Kitasatospora kifunensis TaxID=58351 RepID=A0A7W7VX62_KITKI|nr:hypothetical protein [Kitasatospora kifunensis]MBB4925290.1 DNA-directed RNA polymerase specialized sigma24 family protein [Kitasatospora kifunensis]
MRQFPESAESVAAPTFEPAPPPDRSSYQELYGRAFDELLQQTYLLTGGRRRLAEHAVRRAFSAAWNRWDEVATDPDPARWLRTRAFTHALTPWHPSHPRQPHHPRLPAQSTTVKSSEVDASSKTDAELLAALRGLTRARRQVLVLHDALGLAPAAIALEVEASAAAVIRRLQAAHLELARALPTLLGADPLAAGFGERLGGLLYQLAVRHCPPRESGRQVTWALRAGARLRAAAMPMAAGLLVLGTAGAITGTLNGHGPSAYFHRPAAPAPLCTGSRNGSAGPAAMAHSAGMRSVWCAEDELPRVGARPGLSAAAERVRQ